MDELIFVPRRRVTQHQMDGYVIVEGAPHPSSWAILMRKGEAVTIEQSTRFRPKPCTSNRSAGAISRIERLGQHRRVRA